MPENLKTIGKGAFQDCNKLSSINIPEGIDVIEGSLFQNCYTISTITLHDGIRRIEKNAFCNCENLSSINIPSSVNIIEKGAFSGCKKISSMTIPEGVVVLEQWTFFECTNLQSISIPSTLQKIEDAVFFRCENLTSISLPSAVTEIGEQVFDGCVNLKEVNLPNGLSKISLGLFHSCQQLESIIIPSSVTRIDDYAFEYCTSLKSITFPSNVSSIGHDAFLYCSNIRSIFSYIEVPFLLGDFFSNYNIPLYVPKASADVYKTTPTWNQFNPILYIDAANTYKLTYIVDGEEYKSYDIEYGATITPEPEPTKEGYTFSGWSDIPKTMPANDVTVAGSFTKNEMEMYTLTYMVDGEVYKAYQLEEGAPITPEPAPTKEGYTFSGWSDIPATMPAKDVTVTGTFTKIDVKTYTLTYMVDGVVYKTYQVAEGTTITPEPAPTKEGYTFSGWNDLPSTMPAHDVTATGSFTINTYKLKYKVDGVTYKEYYLEFGAPIIPEPEPTKEGYTFSGWSDIPETMPAHKVTIEGTFIKNDVPQQDEITQDNIIYQIEGGFAFVVRVDNVSGDINIVSSVVVNGVTYEVTVIANEAFKDCTGITSVEIPNSVVTIGEKAFDGCSALCMIKIGNGVKEIARKAFANINTSGTNTRGDDNSLHLYCEADVVPATSTEAFVGTDIANATLHVPDNMVETYKVVAPWNGFGTIVGLSDTGIRTIGIESSDAQVFDLQGNRLSKPRRGMNIIRTKDGKTTKVLVK